MYIVYTCSCNKEVGQSVCVSSDSVKSNENRNYIIENK